MHSSSMTMTRGIFYAVAVFIGASLILTSFTFADSRGRSEGSRRVPTLTNVITKLETKVPEESNAPEAVTNALANEPQNENENSGNNGGSSAGNGGNGGNSSPGGLVKAGNVVSNSTALNAINTVILRISLR